MVSARMVCTDGAPASDNEASSYGPPAEFSSALTSGLWLHSQEWLCHKGQSAVDQVEDSIEAVRAVTEEREQAEVAEDLELLADLVADVGIFRVELQKALLESINFSQMKF